MYIYLQKSFFLFVKLLNQRIKYMHLVLPQCVVVECTKNSQPSQNEIHSDVSKFHCQERGTVML